MLPFKSDASYEVSKALTSDSFKKSTCDVPCNSAITVNPIIVEEIEDVPIPIDQKPKKKKHTSETINSLITNENFPALGEKLPNKKLKEKQKTTKFQTLAIDPTTTKNKKIPDINLIDFLRNAPSRNTYPARAKLLDKPSSSYAGNKLDSTLPERKKGKFKAVPKEKKLSKVKQERVEFLKYGTFPQRSISSEAISMGFYCDHLITDDLNELATNFLTRIVTLQEKYFKKDAIKGRAKKRYVVGFHEVKKSLTLNKAKLIIIAPDINITRPEDTLHVAIKELTHLANTKEVPYLFALKKRVLGKLLLKYIPISCLSILNYDSLESPLVNILNLVKVLKQQHKVNEKTPVSDVNERLMNTLIESLKSKQL